MNQSNSSLKHDSWKWNRSMVIVIAVTARVIRDFREVGRISLMFLRARQSL